MQSEQGATGPFCQHRWKAAGLLGLSIVASLQKGREKYQKNAGEEEMGEVMAKKIPCRHFSKKKKRSK